MNFKKWRVSVPVIAVLIFVFGYAALLVLNRPFMFNPPYGNDITALHRQSVWLANNRFDVIALWAKDQVFPEGGANAYPFGLVPYLYGVLYSLLPSGTVHLIGHCLNSAFIVAAFSISFFLIAKLTGRLLPAFVWSLAALADPVIQSRSAGLGHESLLLLLIMLMLLAIYRRKRGLTLLLLVLMCFVKMSGLVIFVVFICWAALMWRAGNPEFGKPKVLKACAWLFAVVFALYCITAAMDRLNFLIPPAVLFSNLRILHYFMPLTGIAIFAVCAAGLVRYRGLIPAMRKKEKIAIAMKDRFLLLVVIMAAGFWLAFVLYPEPCPRNAAMITFPMAIFAGVLLASRQRGNLLALLFVISGLALSELNLPTLPEDVPQRSSDLLERNLAFVEDLYANKDACDFIAQYQPDTVVLVQQPFLNMLSIPEMGYVKTPLKTVAPGEAAVQHVTGNTIFVFSDNDFPGNPPPRTGDRILYWNHIRDKAPVYIYCIGN
jgi:hypothetical protein